MPYYVVADADGNILTKTLAEAPESAGDAREQALEVDGTFYYLSEQKVELDGRTATDEVDYEARIIEGLSKFSPAPHQVAMAFSKLGSAKAFNPIIDGLVEKGVVKMIGEPSPRGHRGSVSYALVETDDEAGDVEVDEDAA